MIGFSNEHLTQQLTPLYTDKHLVIFCLYLKNRWKLAHRKKWEAPNNALWLQQTCLLFIKLKNLPLFIQKDDSKVTNAHSSNRNLLLLIKIIFIYLSIKKFIKKALPKSVIIIVYKGNLKPLRLFDVIF